MSTDRENGTKRFSRPENLSTAAIVIAILSGGGGLGLNLRSNNEVVAKLDQVRESVIEVRAALKAGDHRDIRIESDLEKLLIRMEKQEERIRALEQRKQ